MTINELNLKALNVSADSVLPVEKNLCVEGKELNFKISAFQSGFGSGKKTVVSGSIKRADNGTEKVLENADIERVRRVCASLCELTQSGRKPRTVKSDPVIVKTEIEKLKDSLAVARRLPQEWVKIDAQNLRKAFQRARQIDHAPKKLSKISALDPEKQLKAYELLKNAGLI